MNRSDVIHNAERWAAHTKKVASLEAQRDEELSPIREAYEQKAEAINECYDAQIGKLQDRADAIETEIREWLAKQKKDVRLESRSAIVAITRGEKLGDRVVDAAKFMKLAARRQIDGFMNYVRVTVKDASAVLGKDDLEAVTDRPKLKTEVVTLELKG